MLVDGHEPQSFIDYISTWCDVYMLDARKAHAHMNCYGRLQEPTVFDAVLGATRAS